MARRATTRSREATQRQSADVLHLIRRSTPELIMVHDEKYRVGLSASRWHGSLFSHCEDVLRRIGRVPFVVEQSEVSRSLRGKGVGVEIYVAAVEEAAKYDGALIASSCVPTIDHPVPEERGWTSKSAMRVWKSKRFAQRVHVDGTIAWSEPDRDARRNPSRLDLVAERLARGG